MSFVGIFVPLLLVHLSSASKLQLGPTALSLRTSCTLEKIAQFQGGIQSCITSRAGGKPDICGVIRASLECARSGMAQCFNQNDNLETYTLNMAVLGITATLGESATSDCAEASRAKNYLFNDVYGGGRSCDLNTGMQRYLAFLQCQRVHEEQNLQSIQTETDAREGIQQICNMAGSFDSCASKRNYMNCMSSGLKLKLENRPPVTVHDSQGVFNNESVCEIIDQSSSYPRLEQLLEQPFKSFKLYMEHGKFFVASPDVEVELRSSGGQAVIGSMLCVLAMVLADMFLK